MITNFPLLLWLPLSLKFHLHLHQLTFPFVILKFVILTSVLIQECLKIAVANILCSLPVWYLALTLCSWPSWQKRSTNWSPKRFNWSLILFLWISASNAILLVIHLLIFQLSHPILHLLPHVVTILKSDALKWTTYTPPISYGLPNVNCSIILSHFKMKGSLGMILSAVTFTETFSFPSKFPL